MTRVSVIIEFDNSNRKNWRRLLPKLEKFLERMIRTKGAKDAWWEVGASDTWTEYRMLVEIDLDGNDEWKERTPFGVRSPDSFEQAKGNMQNNAPTLYRNFRLQSREVTATPWVSVG